MNDYWILHFCRLGTGISNVKKWIPLVGGLEHLPNDPEQFQCIAKRIILLFCGVWEKRCCVMEFRKLHFNGSPRSLFGGW